MNSTVTELVKRGFATWTTNDPMTTPVDRLPAYPTVTCLPPAAVEVTLTHRAAVFAQPGSTHAATPTDHDFAGLVDIGGDRQMYLECRGSRGPTVI